MRFRQTSTKKSSQLNKCREGADPCGSLVLWKNLKL
nr:MAG TPA: hypothetical protein [Caudoviricetes sp.]